MMKRHQTVQRLVKRVFNDDSEAAIYGFENAQVQFYFVETAEKWVPKIRHQGGYLNADTEEEDLLVIDDAWLKIA